ncbi:hypothetical protein L6Q96_20185 [Candidatus Binatia bacterium]|nr:hypothetical protein [Candidatus Binatia bacterium]
MGGILDVAGITGFLGNLDSFHEASDVESAALRGFIAAWWEKHRTAEVGTKELYGIAGDLDLGGGSRQGQKTRLGYVLRSLRDRHFGRIRVEAGQKRQHAQNWKLQPAPCSRCGGTSWHDPLNADSACGGCPAISRTGIAASDSPAASLSGAATR